MRVLLITYNYPPVPTVGALRPASFARWLPDFGIEPFVVTRHPPKAYAHAREPERWGTVFETPAIPLGSSDPFRRLWRPNGVGRSASRNGSPAGRLQRLPGHLARIIHFPDGAIGWYPFALRKALEVIRTHNIDLVLSSCRPPTAHLIAARIKQKTGLPWIADYRDVWTHNPYRTPRPIPIMNMWEEWLERATLSIADCVVTVTKPSQLIICSVLQRDDVEIIYNGFEPSELPPPGSVPLLPTFTITYTGEIHDLSKQNPTPLFLATQRLLAEEPWLRSKIKIRFIGHTAGVVQPLTVQFGLQGIVEVFPHMGRKEALKAQSESHILLILDTVSADSQVALPVKLFEYLATGRTILAMVPQAGAAGQLLKEIGCGFVSTSWEEIMRFIRLEISGGSVRNYFEVAGKRREVLEGFTRRTQTGRLAQLCYGLIARRRINQQNGN